MDRVLLSVMLSNHSEICFSLVSKEDPCKVCKEQFVLFVLFSNSFTITIQKWFIYQGQMTDLWILL